MVEHATFVQKRFGAEGVEDLMTQATVREASAECGESLNIAATGAIAKKGRTN